MAIQKLINEINVDIKNVTDPVAKIIISKLFNIIECQFQENKMLIEENQKLHDENNCLKGEQGKPDIRSQNNRNISSENERKQHNKNNKLKRSKSKHHKIKINRTVKCKINPKQLPEDAVFKGYRTVIVQDISIKANSDNPDCNLRKSLIFSNIAGGVVGTVAGSAILSAVTVNPIPISTAILFGAGGGAIQGYVEAKKEHNICIAKKEEEKNATTYSACSPKKP